MKKEFCQMVELFLQAIDVNLDSSIVIGSEEPR